MAARHAFDAERSVVQAHAVLGREIEDGAVAGCTCAAGHRRRLQCARTHTAGGVRGNAPRPVTTNGGQSLFGRRRDRPLWESNPPGIFNVPYQFVRHRTSFVRIRTWNTHPQSVWSGARRRPGRTCRQNKSPFGLHRRGSIESCFDKKLTRRSSTSGTDATGIEQLRPIARARVKAFD
jgi:hypothetical protein